MKENKQKKTLIKRRLFYRKKVLQFRYYFKKFLKLDNKRRLIRLSSDEISSWKNILYSLYFIKGYFYTNFIQKLIFSFIKNGKKQLMFSIFFKIFLLIKKFWKKSLNHFFNILYLNIAPVLFTRNKHLGRNLQKLPWVYSIYENKKYSKIAIIWIKKSVKIRKEKTLIFRLYSELKDIYLNKGYSILQKKALYYSLYKSRSTFRFIRFLKW